MSDLDTKADSQVKGTDQKVLPGPILNPIPIPGLGTA